MTYTGAVTPGGPWDTRELEHATIRKLAVSAMHNNVYLVTCRPTGEQLLIDAADEAPRVLELIAAGGGAGSGTGGLRHLVTSHRHWDHTRALVEVAAATGAATYAGDLDADHLPLTPQVRLTAGDVIRCGDLALDVLHIAGHTPGSVCLAYRDPAGSTHLFTGDCLFPGGVGASSMFDYQSFDSLYAGVVREIFEKFDDDTWVYPGHGGDTTLGAERPALQEWRERGW